MLCHGTAVAAQLQSLAGTPLDREVDHLLLLVTLSMNAVSL